MSSNFDPNFSNFFDEDFGLEAMNGPYVPDNTDLQFSDYLHNDFDEGNEAQPQMTTGMRSTSDGATSDAQFWNNSTEFRVPGEASSSFTPFQGEAQVWNCDYNQASAPELPYTNMRAVEGLPTSSDSRFDALQGANSESGALLMPNALGEAGSASWDVSTYQNATRSIAPSAFESR